MINYANSLMEKNKRILFVLVGPNSTEGIIWTCTNVFATPSKTKPKHLSVVAGQNLRENIFWLCLRSNDNVDNKDRNKSENEKKGLTVLNVQSAMKTFRRLQRLLTT